MLLNSAIDKIKDDNIKLKDDNIKLKDDNIKLKDKIIYMKQNKRELNVVNNIYKDKIKNIIKQKNKIISELRYKQKLKTLQINRRYATINKYKALNSLNISSSISIKNKYINYKKYADIKLTKLQLNLKKLEKLIKTEGLVRTKEIDECEIIENDEQTTSRIPEMIKR